LSGTTVFSMENRINIPERCWIPLFVFNRLGKIVTRKKLQKLIFLVQEEARIKEGYEFKKHHFGPYSPSLAADIEMLAENEILAREHYISNHEYFIYYSTEESEKIFNENFTGMLINNLEERIDAKLDKYGDCDHNTLTEYVYKKYLPEDEDYEERTRRVVNDLLSLNLLWESHYTPECPLFIDAKAIIEYATLLFSKDFNGLDQVVKGVLLVASEDLIENLVDVTNDHRCECSEVDPSLIDLFDFITYYCNKNDVLPLPEDLDFSLLLTDAEIEQLEVEAQTTCITLIS